MKPSLLSVALAFNLEHMLPTFIWGPPGSGKSSIHAQVVEERGRERLDIRAVLFDPVDFHGIPYTAEYATHKKVSGKTGLTLSQQTVKVTEWAVPGFMPRDPKAEIDIIIDELNAAPQLTQNAMLQLILDRKLGDYELPPGCTITAAGNNDTDRAHTFRMSSALMNRFIHLSLDVDVDDWCRYAIERDLAMEVVAFLRFKPGLLHAYDKNSKAWGSPRMWERVAQITTAKPPEAVERELLSGTVGEGPAAEYLGFLRVYRNLPNPDLIFTNPKKAVMPTDPATLYALCGALSAKVTERNVDALVQYLERMQPEFGVFCIVSSIRRDPDLQSAPAMTRWTLANKDIIF